MKCSVESGTARSNGEDAAVEEQRSELDTSWGDNLYELERFQQLFHGVLIFGRPGLEKHILGHIWPSYFWQMS